VYKRRARSTFCFNDTTEAVLQSRLHLHVLFNILLQFESFRTVCTATLSDSLIKKQSQEEKFDLSF